MAFKGKVAGLMSASPGQFGGVRSLSMTRALLSHLGAIVVPTQLPIARAADAFDAEGNLRDERQREIIRSIGSEVVSFVRKLG